MSNSSSIIIDHNLNWGTVCDRWFNILYDSGGPTTLLQYPTYEFCLSMLCYTSETWWAYLVRLMWCSSSVDCAQPEVRTCERMVVHPVSRSNLPIIICILSSMCSAPMITTSLSSPNVSENCHWISLMIAYSGWSAPRTLVWPGLRNSVPASLAPSGASLRYYAMQLNTSVCLDVRTAIQYLVTDTLFFNNHDNLFNRY